jgi:hypothetical protein
VLMQRQLRFLLPAIGLLSNLAEDPGVQRKMLKRVRHPPSLWPRKLPLDRGFANCRVLKEVGV